MLVRFLKIRPPEKVGFFRWEDRNMIIHKTKYCPHCKTYVRAEAEEINWILHVILSVLTYGFWLIVLLILYLKRGEELEWKCPLCNRPLNSPISNATDNPNSNTSVTQRFCPKCNTEIPRSSKYCPECGFKFDDNICPYCQSKLPDEAKFCPSCGKQINASTSYEIKSMEVLNNAEPEKKNLILNILDGMKE